MDLFDRNDKKRAAVYIRMSTEHQKYSPENQMAAIQAYADKNGYQIVRKYADEGKSGLNLGGRVITCFLPWILKKHASKSKKKIRIFLILTVLIIWIILLILQKFYNLRRLPNGK